MVRLGPGRRTGPAPGSVSGVDPRSALLPLNWRASLPAEKKIAMNSPPYLRPVLAGAFVPTLILPLLLCGFIVLRLTLQLQFPFERGLVFPMALVPSLWALW